MRKQYGIFFAFALAVVLTSCAKEVAESNDVIQDRILNSWIKVNYGDNFTLTESGIYILEYDQGTGDPIGDSSYVNASYTSYSLTGTVLGTNRRSMAEQLGTFSRGAMYDVAIWRMGQGAIYSGVEEILTTMRVGGHVRFAMPPALATITNELYTQFSSEDEITSNMIFDIDVNYVTEDIYPEELEQLRLFSNLHYGGMDTTAEGYYFKTLYTDPDADTLGDEATLSVWYIGKFLDGTCFDTNIQDTAKKYGLYSSDSEYEALSLEYKSEFDDFLTENSVVEGFAKAVHSMNYGDTVVTFFWSKLGYGESGSGTIPGYTPLFFQLYLEEKEK